MRRRRVRERNYCPCCSREIARRREVCRACEGHLAPDDGRPPWERTYFAVHGKDCPYQWHPVR
ncbi:hypothetical protein [Candidatus Nitrospira bockiana]